MVETGIARIQKRTEKKKDKITMVAKNGKRDGVWWIRFAEEKVVETFNEREADLSFT